MCGRYALYGPSSQYREHFGTSNELDFQPRYNIAPSQTLPVVQADEDGNRAFTMARWGLIPSWVKDTQELQQPINAKAETAAIKPMFRHAFRTSRILVPADAFYEWVPKNGKQPYLIHLRDGEPMGMGGLLEHWQGPEGEVITFTILTTDANPLMAKIHDRMPVIIRPEDYGAWLDPKLGDVTRLQNLTRPYPERFMEAYPVSRKVNSPRNDSPDLVEQEQLLGSKNL
jgi:putative SOS response-associated peptidase YedK